MAEYCFSFANGGVMVLRSSMGDGIVVYVDSSVLVGNVAFSKLQRVSSSFSKRVASSKNTY